MRSQKPTRPPFSPRNTRYFTLRRRLSWQLLQTWRTFKKEIARRDFTREESDACDDFVKKLEVEKANQFLKTGDEHGYEGAMMSKKYEIEKNQDYMKDMRDVQQKYLKMLEQYIAKYELAIARNSFPEKEKVEKELEKLQTFKKYICMPEVVHPTGLVYIHDVRIAMETVQVVTTLLEMALPQTQLKLE
jgi:hypothetical protein